MKPKSFADVMNWLDLGSLRTMLERPSAMGYAGLFLMTVTLSLWIGVVPLNETTIASGTVSVSAQRRTISHIDGGKIDELLVGEGDIVQPGQILLTLDSQDLESSLEVLQHQVFARLAAIERLAAEQSEVVDWEYRPSLLDQAAASSAFMQFLEGEKRNFEARRQSYMARMTVLAEPGKMAEEQKNHLQKQLSSIDRQQAIIREQAANAQELLRKGYGTRSRAIELEREVEQMFSARLELEARLADLQGVIDESDRQQHLHRAEFKDKVESDMLATKRELSELEGQVRGLEKKIANRIIRSNVRGEIVDLRNLSVNDVVTPAAPIVDIIPIGSTLVVEAHIPPSEIDGVIEGLDVDIQFLTLGPKGPYEASGRLTFVSADVVQDTNAPQAFYRIQVGIEDGPSVHEQMDIIPGMPAEIFINKGARTLLEYFFTPLADHASRAFAT